MKPVNAFSLEHHAGPYASWPRDTRLFLEGRDTGQRVPGYLIEAQYECFAGFLLITSQDCPFEESNDFLLLDPRYRVVARRSLGQAYGSFLLKSHEPLSETALRLTYHGDLVYTLHIVPRPFRRYGLKLRRLPRSPEPS